MPAPNHFPFLKYITILMILLLALTSLTFSQEHPPKPVTLGASQNMSFGAFALGTLGGTVTISSSGVRSSSGDIILLNLGFIYGPAVFEADANPGTIISLTLDSDVMLTGSNGGSLTLHLENPSPAATFVTNVSPPATTPISIGGTLTVGSPASNPPGAYTGSFLIILNQE